MTDTANELLKRAVEAHAEVMTIDDKDRKTLDEMEQNIEHKKGKKQ